MTKNDNTLYVCMYVYDTVINSYSIIILLLLCFSRFFIEFFFYKLIKCEIKFQKCMYKSTDYRGIYFIINRQGSNVGKIYQQYPWACAMCNHFVISNFINSIFIYIIYMNFTRNITCTNNVLQGNILLYNFSVNINYFIRLHL